VKATNEERLHPTNRMKADTIHHHEDLLAMASLLPRAQRAN
jgi:hypothetical protein